MQENKLRFIKSKKNELLKNKYIYLFIYKFIFTFPKFYFRDKIFNKLLKEDYFKLKYSNLAKIN